ncbi:MAG: protein phosphatase 2C domain-containing protein [Roseburia sp.]|nr:protein phosphatase 2C domain-containing protein [Roseburia sp.]
MFGKRKREQGLAEPRQPMQIPVSHSIHRKVPELHTLCYTETGNRQYQQDAVYVSNSKILAANKKTRVLGVVCDGMGGMADGGKASQTAIQMMVQGFKQIEKCSEVDIPAFFRSGIVSIDKTIHDFPKENGKGSGTTMVTVIAEDNKLYWASVGDSRIYIIRGGNMKQVTRDHNYWLRLQEMVAAGQMTREEAMAKRQKEALISFLGIGNVSLMDINIQPFEMQPGDTVMLCSDGITKTLPDEQIKKIITADIVSMEEKAKTLVRAAVTNNTHSQDNTSVAILQYREVEIKKSK